MLGVITPRVKKASARCYKHSSNKLENSWCFFICLFHTISSIEILISLCHTFAYFMIMTGCINVQVGSSKCLAILMKPYKGYLVTFEKCNHKLYGVSKTLLVLFNIFEKKVLYTLLHPQKRSLL